MPLNAWELMEHKAQTLRAKEPALTQEQAMTRVLDADAALARQYTEQRTGINRELRLRREFREIERRVTAKLARQPAYGSALHELNAKATEHAEKTGKTFAVSFREVLDTHQDLARRYVAERPRG